MSNILTGRPGGNVSHATGAQAGVVNTGVLKVIAIGIVAGGATGTADDVDVFGASAFGGTGLSDRVPESFIITGYELRVTTNVAGASVQLRDAAGGAGNAIGPSLSANATGVIRPTAAAGLDVLLRGTKLYLRRSDRAIVGSLILTGFAVDDGIGL